jgi:hypothetical protein
MCDIKDEYYIEGERERESFDFMDVPELMFVCDILLCVMAQGSYAITSESEGIKGRGTR